LIVAWDGGDFAGAKLAAMLDNQLLTYRRDVKPGLRWPGMIDLPGGGREGDESPAACALRELEEEFGIRLPESRICWARPFESMDAPGRTGWFLVAPLRVEEFVTLRFGDEGHSPQLLHFGDFLQDPEVIPPLKERLKMALDSMMIGKVFEYHTPKIPLFP
jgi:8-oxo-dGTP diphosphatase